MPAEAAAASPDAASAGAVETVDVAGRVEELLAEGRRAFEAHDWLRARASFEEAMEMAPRDRRAQAWLGRTAFQQGRFGEAARLLEPIYRDEGNVDLGKAYVRVGRIQEARRQFELVLQRAPNHAEAREALAALESPPASRDAALRTDAGASGAAAADAARRVADAGTDAASEAIRRSFEGDARAVSASPRGDAGTSGGIRRAYGDE
jgi:tetratricopeptide (TPR) repeat protein